MIEVCLSLLEVAKCIEQYVLFTCQLWYQTIWILRDFKKWRWKYSFHHIQFFISVLIYLIF
jgi:hypothetical protein